MKNYKINYKNEEYSVNGIYLEENLDNFGNIIITDVMIMDIEKIGDLENLCKFIENNKKEKFYPKMNVPHDVRVLLEKYPNFIRIPKNK